MRTSIFGYFFFGDAILGVRFNFQIKPLISYAILGAMVHVSCDQKKSQRSFTDSDVNEHTRICLSRLPQVPLHRIDSKHILVNQCLIQSRYQDGDDL